MQELEFDASPDVVVTMEDLGIGVPEIVQYVKIVLSRAERAALTRALQGFANGEFDRVLETSEA